MAAKDSLHIANGMSTKISHSSHNDNGAPIHGTHKDENGNHAGTNGTRVNGGAANGSNGH